MRYAFIVPAKNEEKNIKNVLNSIVSQSIQPVICLIVDDGSTDQMPEIIDVYSQKYPFIKTYKTEGSLKYQVGAHVANLFEKGVDLLAEWKIDLEYIIKLDADILFEPDLMEKVFQKFEGHHYGIVSPSFYYHIDGQKTYINTPIWHSSGAFKIYNIDCFREIGGLQKGFGWDCADNVMALEKGWETEAFRDLLFEISRPIGRYSLFEARRRQGIGAMKLGYDPLYLIIKGVFDFKQKPYFIGTFVYWFYFMKSLISGEKKILDLKQRKLLRKLFWTGLIKRFKKH